MVPRIGNDVSVEFARRYRTLKRTALLTLGVFGASVISIALLSVVALPGWLPFLLVTLGMLLLFPLGYANSRYRCPACGVRPVDAEGDEVLFPPPATCCSCGARFLPMSRPK